MALLAVIVALLQTSGGPTVRVVTAPSSTCNLTVTPLDGSWNGAAELTLRRGDQTVWQRRHEFGIRCVRVSDAGQVVGFGYSGEALAEHAARPDGPLGRKLRIFALAPDGTLVLDEAHERSAAEVPDGPANPLAADCFVQPELGRFVARIHDRDLNRGAEEWWGYDLASGAVLFRAQPRLELGLERATLLAAEPLRRAPLVLVQWLSLEDAPPDGPGGRTLFQLLDAHRRPVWSLELARDAAGRQIEYAARAEGSLRVLAPRAFELHLRVEGERAVFAVVPENGRWAVYEGLREPLAVAPASPGKRAR